jgi:hypothetical protein
MKASNVDFWVSCELFEQSAIGFASTICLQPIKLQLEMWLDISAQQSNSYKM